MQVFIHRKNLKTHCKLLAEPPPNERKVGQRELVAPVAGETRGAGK
jgi:hypothetical protein